MQHQRRTRSSSRWERGGEKVYIYCFFVDCVVRLLPRLWSCKIYRGDNLLQTKSASFSRDWTGSHRISSNWTWTGLVGFHGEAQPYYENQLSLFCYFQLKFVVNIEYLHLDSKLDDLYMFSIISTKRTQWQSPFFNLKKFTKPSQPIWKKKAKTVSGG
jgi:hypothetical protein